MQMNMQMIAVFVMVSNGAPGMGHRAREPRARAYRPPVQL